MKTYLVTGAAGFIGSNFIKYLLHKKYVNEDIKVIILDASLMQVTSVPSRTISITSAASS